MGYVKEKYTKEYFLQQDKFGNKNGLGVLGVEEFEKGDIRQEDKNILRRINFKDKKVLELGFGRGEALKYAFEQGSQNIIGVDFSKNSFDIADEFLKKFNISAHLFCEDCLVFLKNSINQEKIKGTDVVIMLDFVEHVPRTELQEIFSLIHPLLSEKAIVVINTPVFRVDNDILLEGIKEAAAEHSDDNDLFSGMHCNRYTKESLQNFMQTCEFGGISGHFFGKNFLSDKKTESEIWNDAVCFGYSFLGEWEEECFEYALSPLEKKLQEKENLIQEKDNLLLQKDQLILTLKNSWSWRITAPLRKIADIFLKLKK